MNKQILKAYIMAFLQSRKGARDLTDVVISIVVAGLILFSLFGTMYTQYVSANATTSITSTHSALLGLIMTFLIIGFVLMIWRASKGR